MLACDAVHAHVHAATCAAGGLSEATACASAADFSSACGRITMPKRISAGFRDPSRAFQYEHEWYVGVGCGNEAGAQMCLFKAEDDTLAKFTDAGSIFTTNTTLGIVDENIVWQQNNSDANMMECPDFFPLGDKWVLIGSNNRNILQHLFHRSVHCSLYNCLVNHT